jgi:hypothetical protein
VFNPRVLCRYCAKELQLNRLQDGLTGSSARAGTGGVALVGGVFEESRRLLAALTLGFRFLGRGKGWESVPFAK